MLITGLKMILMIQNLRLPGNKMSTETALFYLLNYTRNRYYHSIGDLKILEVEPCDDFDSDVVWIVRLFVAYSGQSVKRLVLKTYNKDNNF